MSSVTLGKLRQQLFRCTSTWPCLPCLDTGSTPPIRTLRASPHAVFILEYPPTVVHFHQHDDTARVDQVAEVIAHLRC